MTLSKPDSSATCGGWPRKTFAPQSSWLRKPTLRLKNMRANRSLRLATASMRSWQPLPKVSIERKPRHPTHRPKPDFSALRNKPATPRPALLFTLSNWQNGSNEMHFKTLKKRAKEHDGYYSSFTRSFLFDTPEDAEAFRGTAPTSDATRPTSEEQPAIQHPLFDKAALVPVDSYSPKAYNMYRFYSARAVRDWDIKNKVSFKMTKPANDSSTISVNWLNKCRRPLSG